MLTNSVTFFQVKKQNTREWANFTVSTVIQKEGDQSNSLHQKKDPIKQI